MPYKYLRFQINCNCWAKKKYAKRSMGKAGKIPGDVRTYLNTL